MPRHDVAVASVDLSLLDIPRETPPDPDAYLRAAMAWHFGPQTGSPFWLRAAARLEFDPRTDVRGYDDLRLFPNLVDDLRDVPVEDLIPRGYRSPDGTGPPVPRVFESGGTTGAPKRTAQLPDWIEQVTRWQVEDFSAGGFWPGAGLLCMMPSGPHGVGHFDRVVAERLGATFHAIDLDPRWAKRLSRREIAAYVDHVLEQARYVLETQTVANLHATSPLLEAIANDDHLTELVNRRIRYILLSGAHVDVDTMALFRGIFPAATITISFGSTMILSQAATRTVGDAFVFDPRSPYVVFRVVDPATGAPVPYGDRGQIVMNHVSRGMFIPNNLERDTAIRLPGPDGQVGDSVSEVAPVAVFDGEPVIEGVY